MIRKILYADGFGQLRASKWNDSFNDFKKYNVFYGWNYSGKTTLSRMFRCFELTQIHQDYPGGVCKLQCIDNTVIDTDSFNSCPPIKVFNSDFIESNIKWEDRLEPILMIGEENIELQHELASKREELRAINNEIADIHKRITTLDDSLASSLTDKARDIKNSFSRPNYNKNSLLHIVESLKKGLKKLTDYELSTQQQTYFSTDKKPALLTITVPHVDFHNCLNTASSLLRTTVVSQTIDRLKNDAELANWVKKGKQLHEGKTICEFCGNSLPNGLLDSLNQHFSTAFEDHLRNIENLLTTLNKCIPDISLYDESRFYTELTEPYSILSHELNNALARLNKSVEHVVNALNEKKNKPFNKVEMPDVELTNEYESILIRINTIIERHNAKANSFDADRNAAFSKIELHFASEFIEYTNYFESLANIESLRLNLISKKSKAKEFADLCLKIEEQLSESVKGAEQINKYLMAYFGKNDISVKVTVDNSFQLFRGESLAKNLSGGEMTAISFAYFMTRLEDKNSNLSESIVILDDPISSLDINHLFNTYSFIKNHLSNCKQLFILTHNFEFFNLIKDWLNKKSFRSHSSFYLVERCCSDSGYYTRISNMPAVLIKFKSEYHFLFSILHDFFQNPTTDHRLLFMIPNLARRYLEAYLAFKIPKSQGLDSKLGSWIPDVVRREMILKFLHQYSHGSGLPRALVFPDLSECKCVITAIFDLVKETDSEHFSTLVEEITVS